MFFPSRRLALGYLALLLPPLILTLFAFITLARVDEGEMVVGTPLDATLVPTVDLQAQARAYFETGIAEQEQGHYVAAEQAYRMALTIDPALAPVNTALGNLYVVMEQPVEALAFYQRAVKLEPETAEWQRNLGVMQANLGKMDVAVVTLKRAARLAPDDAWLHYELGQVYAYLQRPEEAREAFNRVLTLNPDETLATAAAEQLRLLPATP